MANSAPVLTSVGTSNVDSSVLPYMRAREVEFSAQNLRPGRAAHFFFGDTNVTRLCQRASRLIPDTANANVALTKVVGTQERFYCNSTHAFASAIGAANGTIYINENYICLNITAIGANTLGASDYAVGDIVYQVAAVNPSLGSPTFEGRVAFYKSADKVIVIEPIIGNLTVNTVANGLATLYHSGYNHAVLANTVVQGNIFPTNAVVGSIDNVANKFLVKTYDHRHSTVLVTQAAPNANCVMIRGLVPSDAVGNVIFLTSGQGLGQGAQVLSISGQAAYTNLTFSPLPASNTSYSFGLNPVDDTGHIFGVFNLPETATINFLAGGNKFSISDSIIVDDPNATMVASGTYVSQGHIGAGTSTASTPVIGPAQAVKPAAAQIAYSPSTSTVTNPTVGIASPGPNTTYSGVVSQVNANVAANGLYNNVSIQWPWAFFDVDPIAQTFITPPPSSSKTNYGIFVSSIDIWFNVKPVGNSPKFPVQLLLAETVNGVPTSNVIATTSVQWEEIAVSTTPDSANIGSSITNNKTSTKFSFKDPIYLRPSTNYAIILYSESPDYEVYIGQIGQVDISSAGNGVRRISSRPNVGSFFKSQNASAWTPFGNLALMFVLNKAVFNTSTPVSFTFQMLPDSSSILPYDTLLLTTSDMVLATANITYKVQTVLANTGALEAAFQQVTPGTLLDFSADLKTSSLNSTRRRIIIPGNSQSLLAQVSLVTTDPDVSPVFNAERLGAILTTHVVNKGGIKPENITITNGGSHLNAANIVVTIGAPDLPDGIQATANVPVLNSDNTVPFITTIAIGAGYSKSPSITISEPGASSNATATVVSEDTAFGGNGIARYVTKEITLASGMDSGDLRVFLNAIRPAGTDVCVYYKVLSATDTQNFINVPWQRMTLVQDINSPDQLTPISLAYCPALGPNGLPSGTLSYTVSNVQYPLGGTFKYFAIKIVLFADDATVVPSVLSLQAMALPGG